MKKILDILRSFIAYFCVQEPEVIISEFRTTKEFLETLRLVEEHGQRARSQIFPNSLGVW